MSDRKGRRNQTQRQYQVPNHSCIQDLLLTNTLCCICKAWIRERGRRDWWTDSKMQIVSSCTFVFLSEKCVAVGTLSVTTVRMQPVYQNKTFWQSAENICHLRQPKFEKSHDFSRTVEAPNTSLVTDITYKSTILMTKFDYMTFYPYSMEGLNKI